jgi:cytochrome c peroxidase
MPDPSPRPAFLRSNTCPLFVDRSAWPSACRGLVAAVAACAGLGGVAADVRPERSDTERTRTASELRVTYAGPTAGWPPPHIDDGIAWRELGLLSLPEHPPHNPHSPAKERLGKALFFDPRLSGSGLLACASCHDPDLAWADGRTVSFGHLRRPLSRNAPSIRNVAHQATLFWDGRASSIEEQARAVLLNPAEMNVTREQVVESIAADGRYRGLFQAAFGDGTISFERTAQAIACFERSVVGGGSRFDRFLRGEREILTDSEILGLDLFRREARCLHCHHGPLLSDGAFHDVGLSYYGRSTEDRGRYAVTGDPSDMGRFRTPSLRDVTRTGPLMHNGLFELRGVLRMYNAGMPALKRQPFQEHDPLFPVKSPLLRPLGLNRQDLADLEAFLGSLEEPRHRVRPPLLVP